MTNNEFCTIPAAAMLDICGSACHDMELYRTIREMPYTVRFLKDLNAVKKAKDEYVRQKSAVQQAQADMVSLDGQSLIGVAIACSTPLPAARPITGGKTMSSRKRNNNNNKPPAVDPDHDASVLNVHAHYFVLPDFGIRAIKRKRNESGEESSSETSGDDDPSGDEDIDQESDTDNRAMLRVLMEEPCASVVSSRLVIVIFANGMRLPEPEFPLSCQSMADVTACVTAVTDTRRTIELIRFMGGVANSETLELGSTHLVTNHTRGDSYLKSITFGGCPIVTDQWVEDCWKHRTTDGFRPTCAAVVAKHKLKPFVDLTFAFLGFEYHDAAKIEELSMLNGARVLPRGSFDDADCRCTHLIVRDPKTVWVGCKIAAEFVVYVKWLTDSLVIGGRANERCYLVSEYVASSLDTSDMNMSIPSSIDRKRKLSSENRLPSPTQPVDNSSSSQKRGSSNIVRRTSIGSDNANAGCKLSPAAAKKNRRSRRSIVSENMDDDAFKLQRRMRIEEIKVTEENYFEILGLLSELKDNMYVKIGNRDQILTLCQVEQLFKTVIPIYVVHQGIDLEMKSVDQDSETSISRICKIYSKRRDEFLRVYLPYVNSMEDIKITMSRWRSEKTNFEKYMREFESNVKLRRQNIDDLLIRPIQRIPSLMLLFTALSEFARRNDNDFAAAKKALETIKDVAFTINKSRAKNVDRKMVLLITSRIRFCPPSLASSHREFVREVRLTETTTSLSSRGSEVVLFVFGDCLEFTRSKSTKAAARLLRYSTAYGANVGRQSMANEALMLDSSHTNNAGPATQKQVFKHMLLLCLVSISRVHYYKNKKAGGQGSIGITYDSPITDGSVVIQETLVSGGIKLPNRYRKLLIFTVIEPEHVITAQQLSKEIAELVIQARCLTNFSDIYVEEYMDPAFIKSKPSALVKRVKTRIHRGLSRVFSNPERASTQLSTESSPESTPPPSSSIRKRPVTGKPDDSDAENLPPAKQVP